MTDQKDADVMPVFRPSHEVAVAEEAVVGRELAGDKRRSSPEPRSAPAPAFALAGHNKIVMFVGPGNVGKTTLMRWVIERMFEEQRTALLAAVDPEKRSLVDYVGKENVHLPTSYVPAEVAKWLEDFLTFAMEQRGSVGIDFGGGDTSLGTLLGTTPDLVEVLEEGGLTPVLL